MEEEGTHAWEGFVWNTNESDENATKANDEQRFTGDDNNAIVSLDALHDANPTHRDAEEGVEASVAGTNNNNATKGRLLIRTTKEFLSLMLLLMQSIRNLVHSTDEEFRNTVASSSCRLEPEMNRMPKDGNDIFADGDDEQCNNKKEELNYYRDDESHEISATSCRDVTKNFALRICWMAHSIFLLCVFLDFGLNEDSKHLFDSQYFWDTWSTLAGSVACGIYGSIGGYFHQPMLLLPVAILESMLCMLPGTSVEWIVFGLLTTMNIVSCAMLWDIEKCITPYMRRCAQNDEMLDRWFYAFMFLSLLFGLNLISTSLNIFDRYSAINSYSSILDMPERNHASHSLSAGNQIVHNMIDDQNKNRQPKVMAKASSTLRNDDSIPNHLRDYPPRKPKNAVKQR